MIFWNFATRNFSSIYIRMMKLHLLKTWHQNRCFFIYGMQLTKFDLTNVLWNIGRRYIRFINIFRDCVSGKILLTPVQKLLQYLNRQNFTCKIPWISWICENWLTKVLSAVKTKEINENKEIKKVILTGEECIKIKGWKRVDEWLCLGLRTKNDELK